MFDWQVIMSVHKNDRPRRMSIHTIASVVNRDPLEVLEEMEKSGLCAGFQCYSIGRSPVFYLKEFQKQSVTTDIFKTAREWLIKYPIEKVRGFSHSSTPLAMSIPFEKADADYEKELQQKLAEFRAK